MTNIRSRDLQIRAAELVITWRRRNLPAAAFTIGPAGMRIDVADRAAFATWSCLLDAAVWDDPAPGWLCASTETNCVPVHLRAHLDHA